MDVSQSFDESCFFSIKRKLPFESTPIKIKEVVKYNNTKDCSFDLYKDGFLKEFRIQCEVNETNFHVSKKFKWDDEVLDCSRKSNSEPTTPQRSDDLGPISKYLSLELTPTKASPPRGTPERNAILYPQLIEVKAQIKPKSPEKLRKELKRLKRPYKRDFVRLFSVEQSHQQLLTKIFSYLDDKDIANAVQVSNLWRKSIQLDKRANSRYKSFVHRIFATKENRSISPVNPNTSSSNSNSHNDSPPISPCLENWRKYYKLGQTLNPNQSLRKCLSCLAPAVLEQHIAQCSKCGYIWCVQCLAESKSGPKSFHCRCFIERSSLLDISNNFSHDKSMFISSNTFSSSSSSSGYCTDSYLERSKKALSNYNNINNNLSPTMALLNNNNNETTSSQYHNVFQECLKYSSTNQTTSQSSEPPDSPPRLNVVVSSKKSKKNLRRLLF